MSALPSLQELRQRQEPVWLWDFERARIVWANASGIKYFGGEILFDLVERSFDAEEPGLACLKAEAPTLILNEPRQVMLSFPSAGKDQAVNCLLFPQTLPDGRNGVLALVQTSKPVSEPLLQEAFMALPSPAILLAADGRIVTANHAAEDLMGHPPETLAAVLGSQERAQELFRRLTKSATASDILKIATKIGRRDFQLVLRRLSEGARHVAGAVLLLDDVTERRTLELSALEVEDLASAAPRLLPAEAEAFLNLGRAIETATADPQPASPMPPADAPAAIAENKQAEPIAIGKSAPPPQPRQAADVPFAVAAALDRVPAALIVTLPGRIVHANKKALDLLDHKDVKALINDDEIWSLFAERTKSLPPTVLVARPQMVLAAEAIEVAWKDGPALQFRLRRVETREPANKIKTVEPSPAASQTKEQASPSSPLSSGPLKEQPPPLGNLSEVAPAKSLPISPSIPDSEWRAIIDTATDGIITLDRLGKIQSFSAGAEAIFGYRTAEVLDQFFASLMAPESRKVVRDYLGTLQGPGLASVFNDGREVVATVKQGGTVPLFLTIGALQTGSSKACFCAVVRDITQWKRSEKELREAKEQAEAASRMKSEFLARISHELRTPLNAIMGFSEVIRLERFGPLGHERYKGYVNDIYSSSQMLLSLINDLLDLSKVEAGQMELNFTSVNLGDVADTAIRMLQEQAATARVVVRKAMPANLPNVVADLRSMRQVMLNLLSNAIKFTDPGGQVIISAALSDEGELKLRVKDTGIGMTEEQLQSALQPFHRVETKGREQEGTGLGLPLTKALAEANRADFTIISEPRKGTQIDIRFPTTRVLAD